MPNQINPVTTKTLNNDIFNFDENCNTLTDFSVNDLFDMNDNEWDAIKKTFHSAPEIFEKAFFKLHIKKKEQFTPLQKEKTIQFFALAYLHTKDIRYFNEFLWFATGDSNAESLMKICEEAFYKNTNAQKVHIADSIELAGANELLQQQKNAFQKNTPDFSKRICLIGNPVFFGKIYKNLTKQGFHVEQFFIPYHPNRLINFIASNPLLIKAASVLAGNKYKYHTLPFEPKDERIKSILEKGNFDIGFHKLNFIIRQNIIAPFKIALLNDHWAILPFLRGKSTIAWSVLLGFPLVSTLHFTETGIDSGPIVQLDIMDYAKAKSINEIRNLLRKSMPERVIRAIQYISSAQYCSTANDAKKGRTYYEMHPWLIKYIEENILPLKG